MLPALRRSLGRPGRGGGAAAPGSGTSTSRRPSSTTRRSRVRGCHSPERHHHDHHHHDYTELRDKQQKVWSSGDYNKIAALTVPVSEHLVDHVGVSPASASSTSRPAPATPPWRPPAARRRRPASTTSPELLDIARRRAAAEDLDIDFAQADAEDLPYGDATFDVVLSAIGVMFAADHARAARELVRVCRPGGRIGAGQLDARGLRRRHARRRRPARHPAGRRPAGHPLGRRGRRRRAPRRRGRPTWRR